MNISTQYPTAPLHNPNQVYKKGDLVYNRSVNFVCVQDHGNASGTQNVDPYINCIERGDDSYWSIWAPGRCFGDTAFFYFKKAPFGWIYVKDYVNGKQDIGMITDLNLRDRIMQVLDLPAALEGNWRDNSQGIHFNSLLALGADMGIIDETKVGVLEQDTLKQHTHVVSMYFNGAVGSGVDYIGYNGGGTGIDKFYQTMGVSSNVTTSDETKPKNVRGFRAIFVGASL